MPISDNIAEVQGRVAAACRAAGKNVNDLSLMAVSKTVSAARIREAYASGLRLFGESRVQEFAAKAELLADLPGAAWHMIGHLQSNKAHKAAELFTAVDSLDSLRLAEKLNLAAGELGKKLPVLIEINTGGEAAKSGLAADSQELQDILQAAGSLGNLDIRGLMTVPPFTEDPDEARPFFRALRRLRDQVAARQLPAVKMDILSMGMSHDFEIAIAEGSTCVRIGTAIFGERTRD